MMRNENVLRAEQWTATPNGNGTQKPMPIPYQRSLWSRIKHILPHREDLVMPDGRQIKGGIVLHPIVATALLGAIIGIGGAMYHSFSAELSWQHDQLVVMTTQKADAEKREQERAEELSKRLQNIDAVQIVLGRDLAKLQANNQIKKSQSSQ